MRLKRDKEVQLLTMNSELVKEIYKHVDMLANSKYRLPIETLRTRHKGYESEDFVQDAVRNIIYYFPNKSFDSLAKFKSFMNMSVEWTYLKEKRKYFFTKSRGDSIILSLDDTLNDGQTYESIIADKKEFDTSTLDLQILMSKNLYVSFNWNTFLVGTFDEMKRKKKRILLSVNQFLTFQQEMGARDTVAHYKELGFYMTFPIFVNMSQAILNYAEKHGLVLVEKESKKYVYNRPSVDYISERINLANTCTCGYKKEDYTWSEETWQCPKCGKIHDRDLLVKYNNGELSEYQPRESKVSLLQNLVTKPF